MVVNSMSYATYDSYKDSGVDWLGEIPNDWDVCKLKFLLDEVNVRSKSGNEELLSLSKYQGIIPKNSLDERSGGASTLVGYKKVFKETLVINKMQATNGLLAISKIEGITSPDYSIYKTKNNEILDIDYLGFLLTLNLYLSEFKKRVTGVMEGFIRLYTDDLYEIHSIIPPITQQKKIVNFLNQKTAQIDQAIALKQQQIEKLNEYKQIVIQNAVTKGLNPNAPMKDSGVEWIGDIPEHWEVKKLKHFGVIKSGDSVINSNLTDEGLYEVYGGNGFMGFYNKFNIDKESIIIGRVGALCGNVRYIKEKKWITDNALIFKLNSKFKDYEYLALVLEAGNLNRLNTSNAQPLITGTKVVNFSIPIPCEKERCEILDVIKSFSTKYSQAITNYQTQIHRLKEYKNILINQAVTGKIKI